MWCRTQTRSRTVCWVTSSVASFPETVLRGGAVRYNQANRAPGAHREPEAHVGPVRRLLGRYSLTGRFFLFFSPRLSLTEAFEMLDVVVAIFWLAEFDRRLPPFDSQFKVAAFSVSRRKRTNKR